MSDLPFGENPLGSSYIISPGKIAFVEFPIFLFLSWDRTDGEGGEVVSQLTIVQAKTSSLSHSRSRLVEAREQQVQVVQYTVEQDVMGTISMLVCHGTRIVFYSDGIMFMVTRCMGLRAVYTNRWSGLLGDSVT